MRKPNTDGYYGFKPDGLSNAEPAHVWLCEGVARYRLFGYQEDDWSFVELTEDWQWLSVKFEPMSEQTRDCSNCRALIPGDGNPHVCWEMGNMNKLPDPNTCDKWSAIKGICLPHFRDNV